MDWTALKTEIEQDPAGLGYGPHLAAGRFGAIADLLNTPRSDGSYRVNTDSIPAADLVNAIARGEFDALSGAGKQWLTFVVQAGEVRLRGGETRDGLAALFPPGSVSRANIIAAASRQVSRAELLFGQSVTFTDGARAVREG